MDNSGLDNIGVVKELVQLFLEVNEVSLAWFDVSVGALRQKEKTQKDLVLREIQDYSQCLDEFRNRLLLAREFFLMNSQSTIDATMKLAADILAEQPNFPDIPGGQDGKMMDREEFENETIRMSEVERAISDRLVSLADNQINRVDKLILDLQATKKHFLSQ